MNRGKKVFLASALLLIAILGGAALVFREPIRERWLIWKLEHGNPEREEHAAMELGAMGSLRAIEPLADRLRVHTAEPVQSYLGDDGHTTTVFLGALYAIARMRRETSLPYFESAIRKDLREIWKDALRQLVRVARREAETVDISFPADVHSHDAYFRIQPSPPPGSAPPLRTPRAGE